MLQYVMPTLLMSLLGPFVATIGGTPVNKFRSKSVQGLFIYLAVENVADGVLNREQLAELFYPGYPPPAGRKNLRQTLYELRQELAEAGQPAGQPLIVADRQTVALSPEWHIQLDISVFESGLEDGRLARLEETAALYRGDFLCDFFLPDSASFESWAASRRAYYRRLAANYYDRLADTLLNSQMFERAEKYAQLRTGLDELNENAARQLMEVLAAGGRRSAALAEYARIKELLARQLDVEPAVETEDLFRRIKRGTFQPRFRGVTDHQGEATKSSGEGSAGASRLLPNNLPAQPTPFIGRQQALRHLQHMLGDEPETRLVTLIGPGGSGKSRLALEVGGRLARTAADRYPDGIWFVPLAALSSADSVILAIAKAVDMTFMAGDVPRFQQLTGYLAQRRLVLILDNYEQLLEDNHPPIPAQILSEASQVTIVVTSRMRLNIHSEQLFQVSGLSYPASGSPVSWSSGNVFSAIDLFERSAQRVRSAFRVTEENWPAVVEICQVLDGMPLALELATAWIEVLDPRAIAAEIRKSIDFLSVTWVDIPDRQRSMRAVFNASWELLGEDERASLKRLSVFRGPFHRAAAATVTGQDVRALLSLINKSWLVRDDQGCFLMHELLRQFCLQELRNHNDEWHEARNRHAAYYAGWLQELGLDLRGERQQQALSTIEGSFENIRLAWGWLAIEGDLTALTHQMLPAIFQFCTARNRGADVVAMVGAAQGALAESQKSSLEANILRTASLACLYGGYLPKQMDTLLLGIELPVDEVIQLWHAFNDVDPLEVDALWPITVVVIYGWVTRRDQIAIDYLQKLIAVYEENGQEWAVAFAMKYTAFIIGSPMAMTHYESLEQLEGDLSQLIQQAARLFNEAANRFERLGDRLEQADSLRLVGGLVHKTDPAAALDPLQKAKALFDELGDYETSSNILLTLAIRSLWQADIEEAFGYFRERQSIFKASGNQRRHAMSLGQEAIHAWRYYSVDYARSRRLECQEINRSLKSEFNLAWDALELGVIEIRAGNLALAKDLLGQALTAFEALDIEYGSMFYLSGMGDLSLAVHDYQAAIEYYQASLKQAQSLSHYWLVGCVLGHLSLAYLGSGDLNSARHYCLKALNQTQDISFLDLNLIALHALSGIEAEAGNLETAILLATFVSNHHLSWLEIRDQARMMIEKLIGQLPEGRGAAIQQQALTSTQEALLEKVLDQESIKSP